LAHAHLSANPQAACWSRNYLKGPAGDRTNAILAAASYNFGLLLHWLAAPLRDFIIALVKRAPLAHTL
jgi:IS5 family transposase